MQFVYWPAGDPSFTRFQRSGRDYIHPTVGQVGDRYYSGLSVSELLAIDTFKRTFDPTDPDKTYSSNIVRDVVTAEARTEFTETGFRSIDDLKSEKKSELFSYYKGVLYGGTQSATLAKPMPTSLESSQTYNALMSLINTNPALYPAGGVRLSTTDPESVLAILADFQNFFAEYASHVYLTDDNLGFHRAAIDALTLETDVINYDFTTGWPPTVLFP